MRKLIIAILLFTGSVYAQTYHPVNLRVVDSIKVGTSTNSVWFTNLFVESLKMTTSGRPYTLDGTPQYLTLDSLDTFEVTGAKKDTATVTAIGFDPEATNYQLRYLEGLSYPTITTGTQYLSSSDSSAFKDLEVIINVPDDDTDYAFRLFSEFGDASVSNSDTTNLDSIAVAPVVADYYVSADSTISTIAQVNALSLNAGEIVAFHSGETWNVITDDPLTCDNAGTAGSPVTYTSYGEGAKPIITAYTEVPGWDTPGNWTNTSGDIWRLTYGAFGPFRIWLDNVEAAKAPNATVTSTYKWYYSSNNLYIYSTSNPASAYTSMDETGASQENSDVYIRANYVTLDGLDLQGSYFPVDIDGFDYTVIENCNIGKDCGESGIYAWRSEYDTIRNCTFDTDNETFLAYGDGAITEDGISIHDDCHFWEVYDNTFKNWGHTCFGLFSSVSGDSVSNVNFYGNYMTSPDISYSKGVDIYGADSTKTPNVAIYGNYFYNIPNTNQIAASEILFHSNIIDSITGLSYGSGHPGFGMGVQIYVSTATTFNTRGNQIYNNTIVNCAEPGIAIMQFGTGNKLKNLIKNNILYNNDLNGDYDVSSKHFQLMTMPQSTVLDNTFEYNGMAHDTITSASDVVWYGNAPAADYYKTVTEFNALNGNESDVITNNIFLDLAADLFTDFAGKDFTLKTGANAIGAGVDVGLSTDYAGNAYDDPPSLGALEKQ